MGIAHKANTMIKVQAFETSKRVENWADIQDGRVLWEILRDIDPGYFQDDLPEPSSKTEDHWIPRWQNRTCAKEEHDRKTQS